MTGKRGAMWLFTLQVFWTVAILALSKSSVGHSLEDLTWASLLGREDAAPAIVAVDSAALTDPAAMGEIVRTPLS